MNHKHSKTNNQPRTMNNQLQTTKKELRKINSFMQNKPNLLNAQMNVCSVLTKDYGNIRLHRRPKTNPKQTQFKPKTNPIQTQFKPNFTQNKPNQTQFKPNSNSKRSADPYGQASRSPQTGDQFRKQKNAI